jgi:hypothetical protein
LQRENDEEMKNDGLEGQKKMMAKTKKDENG